MLEIKQLLQFIAQPFADFVSDSFHIPFSVSSAWIFFVFIIFNILLWGIHFRKFFLLKYQFRLLIRLLLSVCSLIICGYLILNQVRSVISNVKISELIISKFYTQDNQKECSEFSESLENEISKTIPTKKSYYFNWALKKYETSILSHLIMPNDLPLVAIGGSCETNSNYGQYSIEFKILKPIKKIKLPNLLTGSYIKFKKEEIVSYRLQEKTADAIRSAIASINALLYECQGDCRKAISVYTEMLNSVAKENKELRAEIYKRLSVVFYSLNEQESAESTISEGIKEQPENSDLRFARAEYYLQVKKVTLAINDLNAVKPNSSNDELRLFYLSGALPLQGKFKEASRLLDKFSKGEINDPELIANVAYSAMMTLDLKKADSLIDWALEKDSNNYSALNLKGLVSGKLGDLNNSLIAFNKAISINPSKSDAYANEAMILLDMNKNQEALNFLNKSFELGSTNPESLLHKAIAISRLTNDKKIIENEFLQAQEKLAKNPVFYLQRGLYFKTSGDTIKAEKDLKHSINLNENETQAHIALSQIYLSKGKKSEASKSLKNASETSDSEFFKREILKLEDALKH